MPPPPEIQVQPLDVVVVLTTQWRWNAIGFAGDPNAQTPKLDALAKDAVWLRQAVTPHPFGVFARAAFLTGLPCPVNGVRDYYDPLPASARTLAHAFGELGYATAFFGKWQLFERDPSAPVVGEEHARVVVPEARRGGFAFWEGFESGFLLNDPFLHGTRLPQPTRFPGYQSDVILDRCGRYLRENSADNRPRFMLVSLDAPHPPYAASASGFARYDESTIRLLAGTGPDEAARSTARRELAGYYAHIEATDRSIGRFVEALRSTGRWARTLFVFTSVHGDMHGVDGEFRKGWPHEESVRIPLLLRGPGAFSGGRVDDGLYSLLDLGATLLRLAEGGETTFPGCDFSGVLLGNKPAPKMQSISMPSVPPFAKQCPYVWAAERDCRRTRVTPERADPFTLEHEASRLFEL